MDQKDRERLIRMEERQIAHYEKLEPLSRLILKHDKDIYLGKKILGLFGTIFSALGLWAATYFGAGKH